MSPDDFLDGQFFWVTVEDSSRKTDGTEKADAEDYSRITKIPFRGAPATRALVLGFAAFWATLICPAPSGSIEYSRTHFAERYGMAEPMKDQLSGEENAFFPRPPSVRKHGG